MPVTTMTEMWHLLDAYTLDSHGTERPINVANEWGGFSRRLNLPVFTAWFDKLTFNSATRETTAEVCDKAWLRPAGVNNQERWITHAEAGSREAAFFVIHAASTRSEPRTIAQVDAERLFVGRIRRDGTKTFVTGQPRALSTWPSTPGRRAATSGQPAHAPTRPHPN